MNRSTEYLNDYNSNLYIKIYDKLFKRLEDAYILITNLKDYNKEKGALIITNFFNEIFNERPVHKNIGINIIKQINTNTIVINHFYINKNMLYLDRIYGHKLSTLLDIYVKLFDIINKNQTIIRNISFEKLLEDQNKIVELNKKTSDFNSIKNQIDRKEKLKKEHIENLPYTGFYHLTHQSNLKNIIKNGLFSHNFLQRNNIKHKDCSNPDIKKNRSYRDPFYNLEINDYVPLYINPFNPYLSSKNVKYEIDKMVLIEILPHILIHEQNTLFSDGNAAILEKTNLFNNIKEFNKLSWVEINKGLWELGKDTHSTLCSEVLIPNKIEISYFENIILSNDRYIDEILELFPNQYNINVKIKPDSFEK
jgi:hypothetical protein